MHVVVDWLGLAGVLAMICMFAYFLMGFVRLSDKNAQPRVSDALLITLFVQLSIMVHEFSHGLVAWAAGGSIEVVVFGFGGASVLFVAKHTSMVVDFCTASAGPFAGWLCGYLVLRLCNRLSNPEHVRRIGIVTYLLVFIVTMRNLLPLEFTTDGWTITRYIMLAIGNAKPSVDETRIFGFILWIAFSFVMWPRRNFALKREPGAAEETED